MAASLLKLLAHTPNMGQSYQPNHRCIYYSMDHILAQCPSLSTQKMWFLACQTWPHDPNLWLEIKLGTIIGTGCLSCQQCANYENAAPTPCPMLKDQAKQRLLQIILSKAAHLVWVLRCKHVICNANINKPRICKCWL